MWLPGTPAWTDYNIDHLSQEMVQSSTHFCHWLTPHLPSSCRKTEWYWLDWNFPWPLRLWMEYTAGRIPFIPSSWRTWNWPNYYTHRLDLWQLEETVGDMQWRRIRGFSCRTMTERTQTSMPTTWCKQLDAYYVYNNQVLPRDRRIF